MKVKKWQAWFLAARPKTLPAAVVPVVIGAVLAAREAQVSMLLLAVILICAVLIQVLTNFANDYFDYLKGADTADRVGPLRVTQAGLVSPGEMRRALVVTVIIALLLGLYLVVQGGLPILIIGLVSLVLAFAYSAGPIPLSYSGLADIFVIVFFGPVATAGTFYLLRGTVGSDIILAGLAPGFISTAILTVNNLRDIEEDRKAKKLTLPARFGASFAAAEYLLMFILAGLIPPLLVYLYDYSHAVILADLFLIPAFFLGRRVVAVNSLPELNGVLAGTGGVLVLYCILFSLGISAGA
ncbi:MAG: 1,4-dihydroxy-2-naphthoate polyprenyltransferase [Candidatus Dadabacteria bacterium]|nr:MAG: 1,4-dihydroxy-2-naphthoate polyprenyltransferase [Candidatus Dadabacteria bacterium]